MSMVERLKSNQPRWSRREPQDSKHADVLDADLYAFDLEGACAAAAAMRHGGDSFRGVSGGSTGSPNFTTLTEGLRACLELAHSGRVAGPDMAAVQAGVAKATELCTLGFRVETNPMGSHALPNAFLGSSTRPQAVCLLCFSSSSILKARVPPPLPCAMAATASVVAAAAAPAPKARGQCQPWGCSCTTPSPNRGSWMAFAPAAILAATKARNESACQPSDTT